MLSGTPTDAELAAQRMRVAFELFDTGVAMKRAQLRRKHPEASEAELAVRLREWLHTRPGAE